MGADDVTGGPGADAISVYDTARDRVTCDAADTVGANAGDETRGCKVVLRMGADDASRLP